MVKDVVFLNPTQNELESVMDAVLTSDARSLVIVKDEVFMSMRLTNFSVMQTVRPIREKKLNVIWSEVPFVPSEWMDEVEILILNRGVSVMEYIFLLSRLPKLRFAIHFGEMYGIVRSHKTSIAKCRREQIWELLENRDVPISFNSASQQPYAPLASAAWPHMDATERQFRQWRCCDFCSDCSWIPLQKLPPLKRGRGRPRKYPRKEDDLALNSGMFFNQYLNLLPQGPNAAAQVLALPNHLLPKGDEVTLSELERIAVRDLLAKHGGNIDAIQREVDNSGSEVGQKFLGLITSGNVATLSSLASDKKSEELDNTIPLEVLQSSPDVIIHAAQVASQTAPLPSDPVTIALHDAVVRASNVARQQAQAAQLEQEEAAAAAAAAAEAEAAEQEMLDDEATLEVMKRTDRILSNRPVRHSAKRAVALAAAVAAEELGDDGDDDGPSSYDEYTSRSSRFRGRRLSAMRGGLHGRRSGGASPTGLGRLHHGMPAMPLGMMPDANAFLNMMRSGGLPPFPGGPGGFPGAPFAYGYMPPNPQNPPFPFPFGMPPAGLASAVNPSLASLAGPMNVVGGDMAASLNAASVGVVGGVVGDDSKADGQADK